MDSRVCGSCMGLGYVTCRRCGGRGEPPKGDKRQTLYEAKLWRCDACQGAGHPPCMDCGGCGQLPPRKLLRAL